MIQVYDRVVPSRSIETLGALLIIVSFALLVFGVIEFCRSQIAVRIGNEIFSNLGAEIFCESIKTSSYAEPTSDLRPNFVLDLENVREFFSSNLVNSYFDLVWSPVFLAILFLFHPWLGVGATVCCVAIGCIAMLGHRMSYESAKDSKNIQQSVVQFFKGVRAETEFVERQNLTRALEARWSYSYLKSLLGSTRFLANLNLTAAMTKTVRQLVQVFILSIGATLVIFEQLTPGTMIAGTILTSRAMAPIEKVLSQNAKTRAAINSAKRIASVQTQNEPSRLVPITNSRLYLASQLDIYSPMLGRDIVCSANFEIDHGEIVAVCGTKLSGTNELVQLLIGAEKPSSGTLKLCGHNVFDYSGERFAQHVGYVPENLLLFEGTIAENIARMSTRPNAELVVSASKEVGIHEEISSLPAGYATKVSQIRHTRNLVAKISFARAILSAPDAIVAHLPFDCLTSDFKNWLQDFCKNQRSQNRALILISDEPIKEIKPDKTIVLQSNKMASISRASDARFENYLGFYNNHPV